MDIGSRMEHWKEESVWGLEISSELANNTHVWADEGIHQTTPKCTDELNVYWKRYDGFEEHKCLVNWHVPSFWQWRVLVIIQLLIIHLFWSVVWNSVFQLIKKIDWTQSRALSSKVPGSSTEQVFKLYILKWSKSLFSSGEVKNCVLHVQTSVFVFLSSISFLSPCFTESVWLKKEGHPTSIFKYPVVFEACLSDASLARRNHRNVELSANELP